MNRPAGLYDHIINETLTELGRADCFEAYEIEEVLRTKFGCLDALTRRDFRREIALAVVVLEDEEN